MGSNHLLLMFIDKVIVDYRKISLLSIYGYFDDVARYMHSRMITMYLVIPSMRLMVGLWRKIEHLSVLDYMKHTEEYIVTLYINELL